MHNLNRNENNFIYFLAITCFYSESYAQNDSLINNNMIDFDAIKTPLKRLDSNRIELPHIYIYIRISSIDKIKILKLGYDDWMKLLCNENTDWAANLYLYSIYRKDAEVFSLWNTRKKWIEFTKKSDLAYWKRNLLHLMNEPLPTPSLIITQ